MSRLSVVLFILCVSYVALGAELRGTHKPGYVITPEEVPVSDIKTTGGCGPKQPCDAAKQEDLLKLLNAARASLLTTLLRWQS